MKYKILLPYNGKLCPSN